MFLKKSVKRFIAKLLTVVLVSASLGYLPVQAASAESTATATAVTSIKYFFNISGVGTETSLDFKCDASSASPVGTINLNGNGDYTLELSTGNSTSITNMGYFTVPAGSKIVVKLTKVLVNGTYELAYEKEIHFDWNQNGFDNIYNTGAGVKIATGKNTYLQVSSDKKNIFLYVIEAPAPDPVLIPTATKVTSIKYYFNIKDISTETSLDFKCEASSASPTGTINLSGSGDYTLELLTGESASISNMGYFTAPAGSKIVVKLTKVLINGTYELSYEKEIHFDWNQNGFDNVYNTGAGVKLATGTNGYLQVSDQKTIIFYKLDAGTTPTTVPGSPTGSATGGAIVTTAPTGSATGGAIVTTTPTGSATGGAITTAPTPTEAAVTTAPKPTAVPDATGAIEVSSIKYYFTITGITTEKSLAFENQSSSWSSYKGNIALTTDGDYTLELETGSSTGFNNMGYFTPIEGSNISIALTKILINGTQELSYSKTLQLKEGSNGLNNKWDGNAIGTKIAVGTGYYVASNSDQIYVFYKEIAPTTPTPTPITTGGIAQGVATVKYYFTITGIEDEKSLFYQCQITNWSNPSGTIVLGEDGEYTLELYTSGTVGFKNMGYFSIIDGSNIKVVLNKILIDDKYELSYTKTMFIGNSSAAGLNNIWDGTTSGKAIATGPSGYISMYVDNFIFFSLVATPASTPPQQNAAPVPTVALTEQVKADGISSGLSVSVIQNNQSSIVDAAIVLEEDKILKEAEAQTGNQKLSLNIPVESQNIVDSLKDTTKTAVDISVTVPTSLLTNDKIAFEGVKLDSSILEAARDNEKDLAISVKDEKGKVQYSWTFDAKELAASDQEISDLDLTMTINAASQYEDINSLFTANAQSNADAVKNALVIDFNHHGVLPAEATVKMYVGGMEGISAGDKIYLYYVNEETGKLDTLPMSSYYNVDKDGYITINLVHCSYYVALSNKADSSIVTSLINQIKVTPNTSTLHVGGAKDSKTKIVISLPSTLELVSSMDQKTSGNAIGAVTVKYSSSNKKVAKVSSDGTITAVGKGSVTITTTIILYSGKKKVVTTEVKVK